MQINRFPCYATFCYVTARKIGYDEQEARSLALTRSKLGSAARSGGFGGKPGKFHGGGAKGSKAISTVTPESVDQILFMGMRPYIANTDAGVRGVMHSNGVARITNPTEYESQVIAKLNAAESGGYEKVLNLLERLADQFGPGELNASAEILWKKFAPMVEEDGKEVKPKFGQKGIFKPEKIERLIAQYGYYSPEDCATVVVENEQDLNAPQEEAA